jgi:L-Lysine epsilon oxidase N-terminal/L-lysine epsilon oxidase C-terminal domain
MATVYKIHPAIGIVRIGNADDAFYVGPEKPGQPGVELAGSQETVLAQYKAGGKIKRQAARFRVFAYDKGADGKLTFSGEVTPDQAVITWDVALVNRKAALDHIPASTNPKDWQSPARPRNAGVPRPRLIIGSPRPLTISGTDRSGVLFDQGFFLGKPVSLGELRTDRQGRLLVLGGRGLSESVPPGEPLREFANNDKWHDDVSDGPVTATVTFPKQSPQPVDAPAWVVVAPPDFAPRIGGLVTLFEVALQAAYDAGFLHPPALPSFRQHLRPMIERAFNLRWVHDWDRWNGLAPNWAVLADSTGAAKAARAAVFAQLTAPGLSDYVLPDFLAKFLEQWRDGEFHTGADDPEPPALTAAEELDRAALEACVGANFFPGIEGGLTLRDKALYAEPFRLDTKNTAKVYPGCVTEVMALPWQADFYDCDEGHWWPSQRPDIALLDPNKVPDSQAPWVDPIDSHESMVANFSRLGFIVPAKNAAGNEVFVEAERDTTGNFKR